MINSSNLSLGSDSGWKPLLKSSSYDLCISNLLRHHNYDLRPLCAVWDAALSLDGDSTYDT